MQRGTAFQSIRNNLLLKSPLQRRQPWWELHLKNMLKICPSEVLILFSNLTFPFIGHIKT